MSQSATSQRGPQDFERAADQNSQILTRLQEAGPRGITNSEMWAMGAHAAHSRIADLRKRGHEITCKREKAGVWRYTLISGASAPRKDGTSGDWYDGPRPNLESSSGDALPLFSEVSR